MNTLIEVGVIAAAVLLSVWPGVVLIDWILRIATGKGAAVADSGDASVLTAEGEQQPGLWRRLFGGAARVDASADETEPELLRGGAWIGALERIAVTLGLILAQPLLIPVVVAVKGLGRFSELKTSSASEKFVIGTLASFLWAGLVSLVAIWLLDFLRISVLV